jgi:hypothetical protein
MKTLFSKNLTKSPLSYFALAFFVFIATCSSQNVWAKDDLSLHLWGQVSPFISGEAGSGSGAPDYDDAFDSGLGSAIELQKRICPHFSLLAGIGYENYDGGSHEGISFDDLEIIPVYVGGKLNIAPEASRWNPYIRLDMGAAHLSSVDVSYQGLSGKYWDSSWVFLFDAGAGVEYRWDRWGASLEVKLRYMGEPDSALGDPSDADASWTLPVRLGVSYYF